MSTPAASVALWKDGGFVFKRDWTTDRDHSGLFPHLRDALGSPGCKAPGLILVGSGPGSYGGVRVALAAADGLAFVHGAAIAAVPSWEALLPSPPESAWIIANARRNGWVTGRLAQGILDGELTIIPSAEMPAWVAGRDAEGQPLYSTEATEALQAAGLSPVTADMRPRADLLIESWLARPDESRSRIAANEPSPIYVRPPHITPAKRLPWQNPR